MKLSRETILHVYHFMKVSLKNINTKACFSLTMNPNLMRNEVKKFGCCQKLNQEGRAYVQTIIDAL